MSISLENTRVSEVQVHGSTFEDQLREQSGTDLRSSNEVEEAQKASTAPAAVDEREKDEDDLDPSPHYFRTYGRILKHRRSQPGKQKYFSHLDMWHKRGISLTKIGSEIRKVCENCGAITHDREKCLERPRRIRTEKGKSNKGDISVDEYLELTLPMDYNEKRDWFLSKYGAIIEKYRKEEIAKEQQKMKDLEAANEEHFFKADFSWVKQKYSNKELFTWDACEKDDVHLETERPGSGMLEQQDDLEMQEMESETLRSSFNEDDGERFQKLDLSLGLDHSEHHAKYSRNGKLIGSQAERIIDSIYEEDALPNYETWPFQWPIIRSEEK